MRDYNFARQNHMHPDMEELYRMREMLEELIYSDLDWNSEDCKKIIRQIIHFQYVDGSFNLLDSYHIESDCRVEFCHEPTYICTALLIKAFLLDKDILTGKEDVILTKALHMCCARGLQGHGFDGLKGLIKAVNYFKQCEVKTFLEKYPTLCPEFTEMIQNIEKHFAERVAEQKFYGDWGEDYSEDILDINNYFSLTPIFVYGTLMKGQSNYSYYLTDSIFKGNGKIEGYEMYDLGYYPGIIPGNGEIFGEVYCVDATTLKAINRLEGEGDLYIKTPVTIQMEKGETMIGWSYIYNRSVQGCEKLKSRYGDEEEVWYVTYGSNLLEERMNYYIKGGYCDYNDREYNACSDITAPCEMRQVTIPFDMYYSNYDMGSWKNSAVSFLDITKPGKAYGRAYKIKKTQLDEIHTKEGKGHRWYPDKIQLADIEGLPAYTFAGAAVKKKEDFSRVSAEYGIVLFKGMKETYPELSDEQIFRYLKKCGTTC